MALILATAAGFIAALAAPYAFRYPRLAPWFLALVPAALTAYFLTQLNAVADGNPVAVSHEWIPALGVEFSLRLDGLSALFALLICGIGTLIVIYAGAYLEGHARLGRFHALLLLFMGSMLGLVLADDLITLFVFWELTSISSFGLISFDSEKSSARAAATQALFVTGGAGLAMLAGFVLLGIAGGTYSISELAAAGSQPLQDHGFYLPILLLVLIGAFAKSAQVPFYFWLPNAMEAPTPVSAYLHSATMVKAGVYLLARLNPALGGSDAWTAALAIAGGATMALGALLALRESDLKRILAYSTLSILGMLSLLIGAGTQETMLAAMVLLLGHALYKAALFLNAGIIDHEAGSRDVDRLGGLARVMPVTAFTAGLAAASMAGVAFFFGFIAKESVYEAVQHVPNLAGLTTAVVVGANVLLAAVALLVFLKPFFGPTPAHGSHAHEAGKRLLSGPVTLCVLGLGLGIAPGLVDGELLTPAASAATSASIEKSLYLWHGVNLTLVLSGVTLLGGLAVYTQRSRIRPALQAAKAAVSQVSPEALYNRGLDAMNRFAVLQTRVLQHGYLRIYIAVVVLAASALVVAALAANGGFELPDSTSGVLLYESLVAFTILAAGLLAVLARTRIVAAIALGTVGYGIALLFLLFGAPDLAMTQILVETLVVLLFVFAFYRLPRFANYTTQGQRLRDMTISIAAGTLIMALMATSLSLHKDSAVSNTMAEASKPMGHGSNVVNVILVDIRALDTLGEISVLLVAALGVLALLKLSLSSGGGR